MNKEVNEKKKRYAIIISFLVLMICITGGTYAYFALTASNNSVTGSVGGASLNLTVSKVYPTSEHDSKNMIPQLESTLDREATDKQKEAIITERENELYTKTVEKWTEETDITVHKAWNKIDIKSLLVSAKPEDKKEETDKKEESDKKDESDKKEEKAE